MCDVQKNLQEVINFFNKLAGEKFIAGKDTEAQALRTHVASLEKIAKYHFNLIKPDCPRVIYYETKEELRRCEELLL